MPPKTKGKKAAKGKASAVVDGLSAEEMPKDQLEEHIIRLREELDREREERSYFQLERDKIQASWEISKRNLEETEAELRNRQRERDEAEERHRVEIAVYKQKLKHVLSEHHNTISRLKIDGVVSASLIQNQHTESELRLQGEMRGLQAALREKQLHHDNCIKEQQLKHQVELMELMNSYDRRIRECEVKYQKMMQSLVEAADKKLWVDNQQYEETMKGRINELMDRHDRIQEGVEFFYSAARGSRMDTQEKMRDKLTGETEKQQRAHKDLTAAQQENKRLREALQEAQQKLPELHKQLEEYKSDKAKMKANRARLKMVEKELGDLTLEHDMLLQAFEEVQQERDELLKKQTEAILDVQQKSGLKELLLERKLAALTEILEKREAQLYAALSVSNDDQTVRDSATNKLEEIFESKRVTIAALQGDLARGCKEYDDLLQTCEQRLKALGVPLYDFPLRPSDQILGGPSRAQNSH